MCRQPSADELWRLASADEGTATHLEDANLAQRSLADLLVFVRLLELLDRDHLPRLLVPRLEDDAVRALADRAEGLVVLHRAYLRDFRG